MKFNFKTVLLFCLVAALASEPAYAEGITKVNDFLDNLASVLRGASIISVTVAIMWAGYKFLFTRSDIMEIGKIVGGGMLIGAASEIGRYLVV